MKGYTGYSNKHHLKRSIPSYKYWRCCSKFIKEGNARYNHRRYFGEYWERKVVWFTYNNFIYVQEVYLAKDTWKVTYYRIDPLYFIGGVL